MGLYLNAGRDASYGYSSHLDVGKMAYIYIKSISAYDLTL